jgi:hypothetical protein
MYQGLVIDFFLTARNIMLTFPSGLIDYFASVRDFSSTS